jgi:U4/U6.U5 tri-snRNP-associated protein 2
MIPSPLSFAATPPFYIKRISNNKFVSECNPTIVTFDARNLDMSPYVEPSSKLYPVGGPIRYDLIANIVRRQKRR